MCYLEKYQSGDIINTAVKNCSRNSFKSPLDLLNGRERDLEEMSQAQLNELLRDAMGEPEVWREYKPFFNKNLTDSDLRVKYMRTILSLAGPLKGYTNLEDQSDEQLKIVAQF